MSDIFDFGFTAVTEDELEAVRVSQTSAQDAEQLANTSQAQLEKLYNAIQPLLNNLKANPEKDYIYWPNRLNKVEQFENFIQEIYKNG
tara:strand:- start:259 stop:522 length:264 start_codon:yes stop_codon:yes gene_type:complete